MPRMVGIVIEEVAIMRIISLEERKDRRKKKKKKKRDLLCHKDHIS